jgi:hypothetical protein
MKVDKPHRKAFDGLMIYFWWNICKERNRRTFQKRSLQTREVAFLYKEKVDQYQWATRPNVEIG